MSRGLVVFFTQGGTTRTIAKAIAKGLSAHGHDVELHDLTDGPPPDPARYDFLGIGCPAHYCRPAIIVSDYLERLPDLSGKPVFTFVLHAAYLGDAGNLIRRALERKGGKEVGYARYRGAGHFLGYLKHGYLLSPAHPRPDAISQAERFGSEIAARLAGQAHEKAARDAPTPFIYRLERFLTHRFFVRHLYSRLFSADREACKACGLCMKACPTRNIRDDGAGGRTWGRDCILCFACERSCPKEAIRAPVTWFLFWPFMVYNTRAAAADPAVECVRVVHANGRTTIVEGKDRSP